jgi:hypothetical protein
MTNIEYIFEFAERHNFPKTNCEVVFNSIGGNTNLFAADDDIISVKFDKSLVENEIKISDIRFDVDSQLPEDVFFAWQKDEPNIPFQAWITMGRYIPANIQNKEFFDELELLTKDIEMKLESLFSNIEEGDGDSDYDDYDEEDDSDYEEDDSDYEEDDNEDGGK